MAVVLHGSSLSPPCRAVLLTAKALGVEVQLKPVDMMKEEHKTEAYEKMNPTHTIPTLDDHGFCIWESRAIMGYLVQRYGKDDHLYPKDPKQRAEVDNMLYFDATCLFAGVIQYYLPIVYQGQAADPAKKALVIERLGFLETILGRRSYAAGERLTIADFSLVSSLSTVEIMDIGLDAFPEVKKWSAKVRKEVPFYDEVTEEGIEKLTGYVAHMFKK